MAKTIFDMFIFFSLGLWSGVFAGDAVKSVTERESVTLEIDDTTDNEIQWRFGHSKILIALINRESGKIKVFDNVLDGRFRDRLELDHQTGSLTITDTRTTDSGLYEVIGSRTQTHLNTFNLTVYGVFAGDAVKSVSVAERESVTLEIEVKADDQIQWIFGHSKILIAQINRQSGKIKVYDNVLDGRFRGRLQADQTGSLTITDTRTTDSGLYEVKISSTQTPLNTFNLTVYARLSVPVISRNCSSSSEQSCSLLCSAVNVSDVSLSWYRGHSLFSNISASDLSISLSLRLEIECLDNNTYSCVINNSISNQTTHLNISTLCQPCAGHPVSVSLIVLVSAAAGCLLIIAAVRIFCICRKRDEEVAQVEMQVL